MRFFLLLISVGLTLGVSGQKDFAKPLIDTLCSKYFFGRGYVDNGVNKAADFLADELRNMGAKGFFEGGFFQEFTHPANIFLGNHSVTVNGTDWILGKDYIPNAECGTFEGKLKIKLLEIPEEVDKSFLRKIFSKYPEGSVAFAIEVSNLNKSKEKGLYRTMLANSYPLIIYGQQKLTASVSTRSVRYPIIESSKTSISKNDDINLNIRQVTKEFKSRNVAGWIKGTDQDSNFIFITAHYDHLGGLDNQVYIPGANDNASGTAMVLNLAKHYSQNPPKKNVVFFFFAAEEIGLLGSRYYVDNPNIPLTDIDFVLNLDLMGTGDNGFAVVNGTVFPEWTAKLKAANEQLDSPFENIKLRGEAANSDHYWFTKKGVPAFFIYTMGGITAYHDIYDKAETLPLTRYNEVLEMLKTFISGI